MSTPESIRNYPNITLKACGPRNEEGLNEDVAVPLLGTEYGFELSCPNCGKKIRIEDRDYAIRIAGVNLTLNLSVACPHEIRDGNLCRWHVHIRNSRIYPVGG